MVDILGRRFTLLLCGLWLFLCMAGGGVSLARDQEVLENGAIRLTLDRSTGLFDVLPIPAGSLGLHSAGPVFQSDGRTVSAGDITKIETQRESLKTPLVRGRNWS